MKIDPVFKDYFEKVSILAIKNLNEALQNNTVDSLELATHTVHLLNALKDLLK